jgi:hypothetical protein
LTDILIENQDKKFEMSEAMEYMSQMLEAKLDTEE